MKRAKTKILFSYPLSIMKCLFKFFRSEVGVAKHFSAKIDSLLSLLLNFCLEEDKLSEFEGQWVVTSTI